MFHSFLSGRGRLPVTNCLLVVLLVFFILISGCQQPGSVTGEVPLLSSGMVPQVELDGFILARQEKPFIVSRELSGLENDIAVSSFTGWISPSAGQEIVGFNLEFSKVEDAQNIYNYLAAREDTWLYLSGNKVFLVR
ncbi:MAG: hypothetical protein U1D67_00445, partial [Dehalococcoidia bacterium]|nr:hypothetical protein [Dehalococcoidia bacterium]